VRLRMAERKAVTEVTRERYRRSGKKEKGLILDEFTALTGYDRSYARYLLRGAGKKAGAGRKKQEGRKAGRRPRKRQYDERAQTVLIKVWKILDYICGKRLAPVLGETLYRLERFGEIEVDDETREKLQRISAATIDRMLAPERKKYELKGRSGTRPGSLLKNQIPMRTFSEWDERRPGFAEIDLVGHDGGIAAGEYLQTLDLTDIYSGWTEAAAVTNKAQVWVFEALKEIRSRLPFTLLGIDSDNGSEFINHQLYRYCQTEQITFTRSRPYRKNDNCFVEQKNYTVVRRHVGYQRLDSPDQQAILDDLYRYLRQYVNYFQPSMRLVSKERHGSAVKRRYSPAETPYQRLLDSPTLTDLQKRKLREEYVELNPAELKRKIEALQEKLLKTAAQSRQIANQHPASHPWRKSVISLQNQRHLE
jgi:Integrase core domain